MIQARVQWNGPGAVARIRVVSWTALQRAVVYFWNHLVKVLNTSAGPATATRQQDTSRGKKGSTYTTYLNPSKPGEAPHKRTGWLQRHVQYELNEKEQAARVGVARNAFYGLFLELGTRRMKPRPWLLATLKKLLPQMQALMKVEEING